jgi:hypothetical protein
MVARIPQLQAAIATQLEKGVKGVKQVVNKSNNGFGVISKHPS